MLLIIFRIIEITINLSLRLQSKLIKKKDCSCCRVKYKVKEQKY